ncbi:MAG: ATP-binding protein [Simkaniaceae bacterium]
MFKRFIEKELKKQAEDYPVVSVVGPRQSGKTTLVRHTFPDKPYINLEALDIQELAQTDPRGFLQSYPEGAILDEIQRVPQLLSYIQVIVDEQDKKGMFILTGSHQLELQQAISQSLAGRTALLTLLPMSLQELHLSGIDLSLDEAIFQGGYPRIFKDGLNPTKAHRNYFQTYIERDLRQLVQVKDLSQFQKFMRVFVGRIGQLVNAEGIANDVGVSSHTIKEWISILEASFVIIRLQPYFENFGKRTVKSPKIYFTDLGLATYLLGIESLTQLARDPLRGNLVENLVVLELFKYRYNLGMDPQLYFFRDAHGHEVDLIFQSGRELIPIEIKAAQTFHSDFFNNLRFFETLAGKRFKKGFLIYAGSQEQRVERFEILNFLHATHAMQIK